MQFDMSDITSKSWFKAVAYSLAFAVVCVVFMLALPFRDVFTGNQQHHFLHGLASAGYGYLANDWYMTTPDPFPLFSLLVSFTYTCLHVNAFYVYHAVFLGLFAFSMTGIVLQGLEQEFSAFRAFLLIASVILFFSAPMGIGIWRILGVDSYDAQEMWHGLADHYLIRRNFEPATIGVLLLVAAWLFLRGNRYTGLIVCGVATTIDPVYVPHFGLLTISCLILARRSGAGMKQLALLALVAFVCVIPAFIHVFSSFDGSSPEISRQAAWISVHFRGPHHRLISNWFRGISVFQLVVGFVALLLYWRKPYGVILAPLYIALVLILGTQAVVQSDRIAMLMPWRLSVLTTPLAVMGIVGWGLDKGLHWAGTRKWNLRPYIVVFTVLLLCAWTLRGMRWRRETFVPDRSRHSVALRDYIRRHVGPEDRYIITFGVSDFESSIHITTGAPVFVSPKIMPHSPEGTIEWYRRMHVQDSLFCGTELPAEFIDDLHSREGVTHIAARVVDRARFDTLEALHVVYEDSAYVLYSVNPVSADSGRVSRFQ